MTGRGVLSLARGVLSLARGVLSLARGVLSLGLLVAIVVVLVVGDPASDDFAIYDATLAWAADDADNDVDASGPRMPPAGAAATAPRPSDGIVWCVRAVSGAVPMLSARRRAESSAPRAPPRLARQLVALSSSPRSPPSIAPAARARPHP
jgi:hypothetical protein